MATFPSSCHDSGRDWPVGGCLSPHTPPGIPGYGMAVPIRALPVLDVRWIFPSFDLAYLLGPDGFFFALVEDEGSRGLAGDISSSIFNNRPGGRTQIPRTP